MLSIGLVLVLVVDFIISWSNAHTCGTVWSESKETGGFFRVNVVAGYIMSIIGFTQVYGIIYIVLFYYIGPHIEKFQNIDFNQLALLSSDLLFVGIGFAIIPTGFLIWINSLRAFWKNKTLKNGVVGGWNSYAQLRNTITVAREMPSAVGRLTEAFFGGGKGKKKKSDGVILLMVVFIVIMATLAGYFTASAIMKKADREYDAFEGLQ